MKTFAVLIPAVLAQATGNVYLSKGMKEIASVGQIGQATENTTLDTGGQEGLRHRLWR
ncbi:MAG: hypothetical protein JRI22_13830 [Deltaproteobacteria bacterium]|nr:hypothetical protein [Deltaproteobacteria bacterium]